MRSTDTSGFLLYFTLGFSLRCVVGLLMAPASGAATREFFANRAGRGLYEKGRELAEEAAALYEEGRHLIER